VIGTGGGVGAVAGGTALGSDCGVFDAAWTDFTIASAVPVTSSTGVADAEGAPETEPARIAAAAKTTPRPKQRFSPDCITLVSTQYLDIYTWEAL
jgi:hypothetical protein